MLTSIQDTKLLNQNEEIKFNQEKNKKLVNQLNTLNTDCEMQIQYNTQDILETVHKSKRQSMAKDNQVLNEEDDEYDQDDFYTNEPDKSAFANDHVDRIQIVE